MKRILAAILAVALLSTTAFAAMPVFSDISDQTVAQEVDVLRMLGVVNGMSETSFAPNGTLTRAQFCKMAIQIMGLGDIEPQYRSRTIFPDVTSTHWARGYINLAVTGESKIIMGMGDGTFSPDTPITYAQAVTILMRILGYKDADVGLVWPSGYLDSAAEVGLTKGLGLSANASPTRAQAVKLFCNLLNTNKKDSTAQYASVLGSLKKDTLVLANDVTADDGSEGAVLTSAGKFKMAGAAEMPDSFTGLRGTLVLDENERILTFIPGNTGIVRKFTVSTAGADYVKASDGTRYPVPGTTTVYRADGKTTFSAVWMDISAGSEVTLYYSAAGKLEIAFIRAGSYGNVMVAKYAVSGNPFAALVGSTTGYTIYKNGAPALLSDIKQYDVASYNSASKILSIWDTKLTGVIENASPNIESATEIKLLGHTFNVLPTGAADLAQFKIGSNVTLLLTADNAVAGVVTVQEARGDAVGIATGVSSGSATVKLLSGITVSGNPELGEYTAGLLVGQLVTVNSYSIGRIIVTRYYGSEIPGDFDIPGMKLGDKTVSPAVRVFETVGNGYLTEISLDDIRISVVPREKIKSVMTDYAGRVSLIVLNDVTGDRYTYGLLEYKAPSDTSGMSVSNPTVTITNSGKGKTIGEVIIGGEYKSDVAAGLAAGVDGKAAGIVMLTAIENVPRSAFSGGSVTLGNLVIPVAEDVECYNETTGLWFDSLDEARAFSSVLTVYYDRDPSQGGEIRMVVAK